MLPEQILEKAFGPKVVEGQTQAPAAAQNNQAQADGGEHQQPAATNNSNKEGAEEQKFATSGQYYQAQRDKLKNEGSGQSQENNNSGQASAEAVSEATKYENTFLSERLGGKFKSVEELTTTISEVERLRTENKELAEKAKDYIKPANDFIRKFNQASERNIPMESFLRIEKFTKPLAELTPTESIERIAVANEVEFKFSSDDALFTAQRKYKLALLEKDADGNYPDGADPDDVREAQLSLKRDVQEADKKLQEYKVQTLEPLNHTPETAEQKTKALQEAWAPELPKIQQKFNKMAFTTMLPPDKGQTKGQELSFDFAVPADVAKQIPGFINDLLAFDTKNGAVVGQDNDLVEAQVRDFIIPKILPQLMQAVAFNVHQEIQKKELNKGYNSSARQEQAPAGGNTGKPDKDRVYANALSGGKVPIHTN